MGVIYPTADKPPRLNLRAPTPALPQALLNSLRPACQRQIDHDGAECGVSRQALDELMEVVDALIAAGIITVSP